MVKSGLVVGEIGIKGFVCDAPAKAYLLGVGGNVGYNFCTNANNNQAFSLKTI